MADVTLFDFRFSPFAQRVQIALREKEIPFELIPVQMANKPQALLDANPVHKKVPTIIHNGKPVAESLVILEYLDDAFPDKVQLMPKDAFEKAKVRFWTDYIYQSLATIWDGSRAPPGTPEKQAAFEVSRNFINTMDATMTSFSADGPFFTGDKFGYLDVVLAPLYMILDIIDALGCGPCPYPGPGELPRLSKWAEVVRAHPSVSATIPPEAETADFVKARFKQLSLRTPEPWSTHEH